MFVRTAWQRRLVRDFDTAWQHCVGDDAPEQARAQLHRNGWHDLLVSARDGGLGLGGPEAALLAESLGRALLPGEALDPVLVATTAARPHTPMPTGDECPRVAICPPTHPRATRADGSIGYLLHRVPDLLLVPEGPTRLRTIARGDLVGREHAGPAGDLWAVAPRSPAPGEPPPGTCADAGALWARAVLLRAAHLLGIGAVAVTAGLSRARERDQFGRSIGRYQSVAVPLAAGRARLEGLRLAIGEQLLCLEEDPDDAPGVLGRAEAIMEALRPLVRDCVTHGLHVHGAAGLAEERIATRCYRRFLAETPARPSWPQAGEHPPAEPPRRPRVVGPPVPADPVASARRRVPHAVDDTAVARPGDATVHGLFEQAAARYPDRPAVRFGATTSDYREVNERANRLAHVLREHGVGPDTPVGVCLDRDLDAIVAILAVLKAGGAYVPIDPEYPPARIAFLLEDSAAVLLLTRAWMRDWLPDTHVPILFVDHLRDRVDRAPHTPPDSAVTAAHLAYVIYTSGSTGTPKGVEIEHRNLVNRLLWDARRFPLTADDAILQHTSLSFDISVWEIFAPLISGARLVVAPPKATRDPHALLAESAATGVTVLACVPSLLDLLVEEREPALADLPGLRYVFSGGEALSPELVARFHAATTGIELHNFYGPSECTIDVTHWHCRRTDPEGPIPIGTPIDNVRVHVLDEYGMPVPIGYPGELHVAGAGLARGYRARPGPTAERFAPDPFANTPGGRLYRTGDVVIPRRDGALEFLGRSDHQVKIRGHRIEPGEIQDALEAHPHVRTAVLNVIDGRIEAHVVPAEGVEFDEGRLRAHLRERLPEYMLPSGIGALDAIPLETNGKIDRRALPNLAARRAASDRGGEGDEGERALSALAARVLGVEHVAATDDFFAAGGSSLHAARFVARARRELGIDIDLENFLAAPTVAAVSARSKQAHDTTTAGGADA
ncbi:amino acid adenylation domain-containing protein [Embleya sp. NPDC008237]|uniref:amino acid adenylation domain-containing protein n=1 Tax=Embleya sp. NPDC008237 TaxID=3363978 RepID=UPI0036F0B1FF